jgi:hypothetical protein
VVVYHTQGHIPENKYELFKRNVKKIRELASKQTRANIKTFKIIFIVYKIDKL